MHVSWWPSELYNTSSAAEPVSWKGSCGETAGSGCLDEGDGGWDSGGRDREKEVKQLGDVSGEFAIQLSGGKSPGLLLSDSVI